MTNMEIINRIRYYMNKNEWSSYRLVQESGLSKSTIEGVLDESREGFPHLETIDTLCSTFNVTEGQFFDFTNKDNMTNLTDDEMAWVELYRSLPKERIVAMLAYCQVLMNKEKNGMEHIDIIRDIIEECVNK